MLVNRIYHVFQDIPDLAELAAVGEKIEILSGKGLRSLEPSDSASIHQTDEQKYKEICVNHYAFSSVLLQKRPTVQNH
jgi:hypothetical protein